MGVPGDRILGLGRGEVGGRKGQGSGMPGPGDASGRSRDLGVRRWRGRGEGPRRCLEGVARASELRLANRLPLVYTICGRVTNNWWMVTEQVMVVGCSRRLAGCFGLRLLMGLA